MNRMFLLRGAPGSGKSTWVAENGFEDITVSPDQIRIDVNGLDEDENGIARISQRNAGYIWRLVEEQIESFMQEGSDIILDSTMAKAKDLRHYITLIEDYDYKGYVVDFSDVGEEECHSRNEGREEFRIVPEHVITRFYDNLNANPVPDFYEIIYPEEAAIMINNS